MFAKYAIKVDKVELFRHKTYPVFHVEFPFEPTEGFENARALAKLEAELFVANGHYDYGMQDDSRDVLVVGLGIENAVWYATTLAALGDRRPASRKDGEQTSIVRSSMGRRF
ncbi:MAG: hypothetical protein WCB44_20535 [Stellaceae bacterium]